MSDSTSVEYYDGTISYLPDATREWGFNLVPRFSEEVNMKSFSPLQLQRLQASCGGALDMLAKPDGLEIHAMPIVAHGPESARLQAVDLSRRMKRCLGLNLNVAAVRRNIH